MDFEEMQVVWDEQKKQRLYALDLDALHMSVRRRGRRIARGVEMMELGVIVTAVVTVVILAAQSKLALDSRGFLAATMLAVAAYLLAGRLRRRARERKFEPNLRGDIELAISQLEYHISRIRTFPLWFCAPLFVAVVAALLLKQSAKPSWAMLLVLGAFPLAVYVTRLELRCLLPRKRELEALRAKLTIES
ncbi:MAG TPA: hypothetical protein VM509_01010 [Planctomycetota bacterium]|nr:hypothetical protein [Planctomycetota bacterium]